MPFFLSHMGRKSGSGTTIATRHAWNAAEWKGSSHTLGPSANWPMNYEFKFLRGFIPASCRRGRISGPRGRSECTQSRSSPARCIPPAPAWKCASSCLWSSECRSETRRPSQQLHWTKLPLSACCTVNCQAVELCLLGAISQCPQCAASRPRPGPRPFSPGPSGTPGTRLVLWRTPGASRGDVTITESRTVKLRSTVLETFSKSIIKSVLMWLCHNFIKNILFSKTLKKRIMFYIIAALLLNSFQHCYS